MVIKIFTDGGAIGNPGPAACAFLIYQGNKLLFSHHEFIGRATNNVAEYTALIKALEKLKKLITDYRFLITSINVYSDSRLLVNQINGYFKVKSAVIREFIMKIRVLEGEIGFPIAYKNIPREKNVFADALVKRALMSS